MSAPAFLCGICLAGQHNQTELADHIAAKHAPAAVEPSLDLARRIGFPRPCGNRTETLEPVDVEDELGARRELDGFLEHLRSQAAVAIQESNRPRLVELKCELEAIARVADFVRVFQARIERVSRESAALFEGVINTLPEDRG